MSSKKLSIQNDFYYLKVIIKKIIGEKKIILTLCSILMVIGFIYSNILPPKNQSQLKLNPLPQIIFSDIRFKENELEILNFLLDYNLLLIFNEEMTSRFNAHFKQNLNSDIFLEKFVNQNNEIAKYKIYLEKKGISPEKYFINNFKPKFRYTRKKDYEYSLIFEGFLDGDKFLDDYVFFNKKQTELILASKINEYLNLLIKLKKDKLEKDKFFLRNENELFELEKKILYLNDFAEKIKSYKFQFELDYNPYLKETSTETLDSRNSTDFILLGLFSGLFFSFVIIFFKNIIK